MICRICGDDYPEEELEDGICLNCKASIIHNPDIPLNEDFL